MKDRRFWACCILLALLLPVLLLAQRQPVSSASAAPPPAALGRSAMLLEGPEIPVPVTINPNGPLFGLTPLVDALGGTVTTDESGESVTLRLGDMDIVLGPSNSIVTVGDNIVSLSQPPTRGEGGSQVPVKKTWGDLVGYAFDWHPETSRLTIVRRGNRELGVRALQVSLEPKDRIHKVVEALLAGPKTRGLARPFPEGVTLGSVLLSPDVTAYVDLCWQDHADPPPGGSTEEIQRVYSVVDSIVLSVPQASRVVLLWNGSQRETFSGHLDLSVPLTADRTLPGP